VVAADRAAIVSGEDYELEYRVLAADRRVVWFREIVRVEADLDGRTRRLRGVMVDITAQRESDDARLGLEEQLRHSQKMEAVGQLAGGIAHDFNNLLTAICGYSEFALSRLDDSSAELRGDIEEIARAGERAAQLTRQLLAFSRRSRVRTFHAESDLRTARLSRTRGKLLVVTTALVVPTIRQPLHVVVDATSVRVHGQGDPMCAGPDVHFKRSGSDKPVYDL
jgi:signal transduction histidine kinase